MWRSFLLVGGIVFAFLTAAPYVQGAQSQSLNAVKTEVLAATGYDDNMVELTATKVQFVVTIVNSKLNGGTAMERENEANRIASTIAHSIADEPEFKGIQAIHVDYVKREGAHMDTLDSMDFRKDPDGNFRHHIT
jgi:hypothetical protein